MVEPTYEIYAIKYATRQAKGNQLFHHKWDDTSPVQLDYYIWAIKSEEHTLIFDTGTSEAARGHRNPTFLRDPIKTLEKIGIKAEEVPYVVISHMNWDHMGNLEKFPKATIVLQEDEMAFYMGKNCAKKQFSRLLEYGDICQLVKANLEGRLQLVSGSKEVIPGITVHLAGGHSPALQFIDVKTKDGNVLLLSDASHLFRNIDEYCPHPTFNCLADSLNAFDIINSMRGPSTIIIPGHEPKIMEIYPPPDSESEGIIAKIS